MTQQPVKYGYDEHIWRRYASRKGVGSVSCVDDDGFDYRKVWRTCVGFLWSVPPDTMPIAARCDFESDLCSWRHLSIGFQWRRHSGPTPTPFTGPNADHTLGTAAGENVSSNYLKRVCAEIAYAVQWCDNFAHVHVLDLLCRAAAQRLYPRFGSNPSASVEPFTRLHAENCDSNVATGSAAVIGSIWTGHSKLQHRIYLSR